MHTRHLSESPRHLRGGQTSYLLLTEGQANSQNLTITWVKGEPGSQQNLHAHPDEEQVYVIVAGRGLMHVADEEREVGPGTMILVPKGASHAIRNVGSEELAYVSATAPPFDATWLTGLYETPPEAEESP
jgi:mannose-6-phosphate isomerase-like protein (cupin superfamily)